MRSIFLRVQIPIFCLAAALIVTAQLSLFPLQAIRADIDPSVYLYIGRQMHRGAVPYIDLFDHKGPLLYFIQYAAFVLTPNGYGGIWIIEFINLAVTAFFLYRITALLTEDNSIRYLAVIAALVLCSFRPLIAEGGNIVEEYALPWIASSLYVFLKYFIIGQYRFYEIVLLGIGFAAVSLLRVNMIAVWMFFLPVVVVYLLFKKRFRDLWVCIGGFLLGIAVICIPVLLWLLATNSLQAMIECYLQFNFGYSDVRWLERIESSFVFLELLWFAVAAALISLCAKFKSPVFWLNAFCTGITLILCSLSGRGYHHYAVILIPLTAPFFVWAIEAIHAFMDKVLHRFRKPRCACLQTVILSVTLLLAVIAVVSNADLEQAGHWSGSQVCAYLTENTDEEDDVLILGNRCLPYLQADRQTENKFFFQTPPIDTSDALYDAFVSELDRVHSDIILVPWEKGSWTEVSSRIGDICAMFDEKVQSGEYTYEDHGTFYVYRYLNGKDTWHG